VVRRAKVTKGALYHHFANKLELYQAVVEDMEREVVTRLEAAAEAEARTDPGDGSGQRAMRTSMPIST
jgi:AcrR family transcriptional regulator